MGADAVPGSLSQRDRAGVIFGVTFRYGTSYAYIRICIYICVCRFGLEMLRESAVNFGFLFTLHLIRKMTLYPNAPKIAWLSLYSLPACVTHASSGRSAILYASPPSSSSNN